MVPAGEGQSRITLGDMDTEAASCGGRCGDPLSVATSISPSEILQPQPPSKGILGQAQSVHSRALVISRASAEVHGVSQKTPN